MDFGALRPEINSARMYAGAGSAPLLAAATAWNSLAAELSSAVDSYQTVINGLTDYGWQGPASDSMAAAVTPYLTWMSTTATQAEQTAGQANAAAGAYEAAYAATVPPAEITANRAQLTSLQSTNILGQNASAIAAVEAQYGEMWAQDAAAMYGYAANSAAASKVSLFSTPSATTSSSGLANQSTALAQTVGSSSSSGAQSSLSQLVSAFPNALQNLASPAASSTSTSPLAGLLGGSGIFAPGSNTATSGLSGLLNTLDGQTNSAGGTFLSSGLGNGITSGGYLNPALLSPAATSALADINSLKYGTGFPGLGNGDFPEFMPPPLGGGSGIPALSSGLMPSPVSAGVGQAALVGKLAVPQGWAPANQMTTPLNSGAMEFHTVGSTPGAEAAAGMPGMPGMPMMGSGSRSFSFAVPRYGFRPTVMAQPPAAG